MDNNDKRFRIGGWQWVLYALVAALIIGSIMRGQSGETPDWQKCKESLFNQMLTGECTLRRGFAPQQNNQVVPSSDGKNI